MQRVVAPGGCHSQSQQSKYAHVELLSCHPMFAPAAGWEGQNTVMIEITGGSKSKAFTALVETWGSTCVAMESGEQHDRVTAAVQTATHSALITFGLSLKKIGYDADMASKISTPPHRAMISVIQRMASINEPDTYWDIQVKGPEEALLLRGGRSASPLCLGALLFVPGSPCRHLVAPPAPAPPPMHAVCPASMDRYTGGAGATRTRQGPDTR